MGQGVCVCLIVESHRWRVPAARLQPIRAVANLQPVSVAPSSAWQHAHVRFSSGRPPPAGPPPLVCAIHLLRLPTMPSGDAWFHAGKALVVCARHRLVLLLLHLLERVGGLVGFPICLAIWPGIGGRAVLRPSSLQMSPTKAFPFTALRFHATLVSLLVSLLLLVRGTSAPKGSAGRGPGQMSSLASSGGV